MKLDIIQVEHKHREVLDNLMQFYIYDFSEFMKIDVEEDGRYSPYPLEEYLEADNQRFAYIIKQDNKYVGFVLVRVIELFERQHYSIAEFFVLKKYRQEGIGKAAAFHIFNQYKGPWEVHQMESNQTAQRFWNKVINEYTKGQFKDWIENGKRIQTFVN